MHQSASAIFSAGTLRAVELCAEDTPELQRFFELNPEYFFAVNGEAPGPAEAHEAIHSTLPDGWTFTRQWTIGFVDEMDSLVGMANVVSDLLASGVWHIGLLIVATRLHGSGAAQSLYEHLESWARDSGAQWFRLGVVEGNTRAERFWERCAFVEIRKRTAVEMGKRVNVLRVMAKPLAGRSLDEYLTLVPRDRPEPC
ncbi:MAG: GNAT family N-acetyltransferase [Betaproteobacteria bacterium]